MNGTHLARFFVSIVFVIWAAVALLPLSDTPFEVYLVERVTDRVDPEGDVLLSAEENRESFEALLARAEERVAASRAADATSSATLFTEFLALVNEEDIDLADYYKDLRISDIGNLDKRNALVLTRLLKDSKGSFQLGLDLAGGVSVTLEVPEDSLREQGFMRQQELNQARQVILNRIDAYGVAEPVVRVKGDNQIEVQIAGLNTEQNTDILIDLIRPAKLEFSTVHRTATPVEGGRPPIGYVLRYAEREDPETGRMREIPLYVKRVPIMTGDAIESARARITPTGGFEIDMNFTSEGGQTFAEVTGQMAAENADTGTIGLLAIILDGKVESYPSVRERIAGGSARITGNFSQREALSIATALNNPLSVELEIAAMNNVSGTLADEAKAASVRAGVIGGGLVVVFMIAWYGFAGMTAVLTVAINILLVIGALAAFGATMTLPGVAALVLTIGMAVDANILIFERIREELKAGKSIAHAVTDGFGKALSTILDANVTTLITALILIWLGTGPVRGFGLTLAIGIGATVLTSLVTNRFLMETFVGWGLIKSLPNRLKLTGEKEIPFLQYARRAFFTSWAIVLIGVVAFIAHFDQAFGPDFTGGDEVTFTSDTAVTADMIESVALAKELGAVTVLTLNPLGATEEMTTVQTRPDAGLELYDALVETFPEAGLEQTGFVKVGASVGAEVTSSALKSIALSLFAMLFYIAIRFEFGFGLGALTATVHDILLTVGLFFVLGEFFGLGSGQFTAPMIAAVLMTVGYSINDTIVVFDRVREELELNPGMNLKRVIHLSINLVLSRTILTSLTTIFASLALFLFGAGVIVDFALVFLIGVITGTFSSIFIASPIFFWYHKGDRKSVERGEILPSYDWGGDENAPAKGGKATS